MLIILIPFGPNFASRWYFVQKIIPPNFNFLVKFLTVTKTRNYFFSIARTKGFSAWLPSARDLFSFTLKLKIGEKRAEIAI